MKKESSFLNLPSNKLNKKTLNTGKSILYPEVEINLINFIEFNRKCLNPISTWSLLLKLYALVPERKELSIKTNQMFIYRLLRRNGYSFRTKTHIGQKLSENCFIQASLFLNECLNKRLEYNFWDAVIGNFDETPIVFNMIPNETSS